MSVKLIVLKTGEQLIADVQEMIVEEKTVGFYLTKCCMIRMINPNEQINPKKIEKKIQPKEKTAFDISLFPWIPLAKGTKIPVPYDSVLTFVEPVDMLYEMYNENVLNSNKDWGEGMNRPTQNPESDEYDCKTCR